MKPIGKVQVLSADGAETATLGWAVREFNGGPLYLFDGTPPERGEDGDWVGLEDVTEKEALKPGVQILVSGMFGELILMTVEANEHGELQGRSHREDGSSGQLIGLLAYGEDERGIWACTGWVNMSGVTKLEKTTDG